MQQDSRRPKACHSFESLITDTEATRKRRSWRSTVWSPARKPRSDDTHNYCTPPAACVTGDEDITQPLKSRRAFCVGMDGIETGASEKQSTQPPVACRRMCFLRCTARCIDPVPGIVLRDKRFRICIYFPLH